MTIPIIPAYAYVVRPGSFKTLKYEDWSDCIKDRTLNPNSSRRAFLQEHLFSLGNISLTSSNCGLNIITLYDNAKTKSATKEDLDKAVYMFMIRATQLRKHRFWLVLNETGKRFQEAWPTKVKSVNADFAEMHFTGDANVFGYSMQTTLNNDINYIYPEDIAHELR